MQPPYPLSPVGIPLFFWPGDSLENPKTPYFSPQPCRSHSACLHCLWRARGVSGLGVGRLQDLVNLGVKVWSVSWAGWKFRLATGGKGAPGSLGQLKRPELVNQTYRLPQQEGFGRSPFSSLPLHPALLGPQGVRNNGCEDISTGVKCTWDV